MLRRIGLDRVFVLTLALASCQKPETAMDRAEVNSRNALAKVAELERRLDDAEAQAEDMDTKGQDHETRLDEIETKLDL